MSYGVLNAVVSSLFPMEAVFLQSLENSAIPSLVDSTFQIDDCGLPVKAVVVNFPRRHLPVGRICMR